LNSPIEDDSRPDQISLEIPLNVADHSDYDPDPRFAEIPPEEFERVSRLPQRISPENRPPMPLGVRIAIFVVGWLLILIGVAGLVLPGIQGVFTIVVGAALISLDNELVYRGLRRVFQRWPKIWDRIERFREKAHDWIHRRILRHKD
jgi:hypothetical protein